ncbi:MAG: hypothetical protein IIA14_12795 [SAR324 cluster bacterium]|nr:hypothetical protein [SAR324 cluster bacterium]
MEIALKNKLSPMHAGNEHFSPPLTGTAHQKAGLDFERNGISSYTIDKIKEFFDWA